MPLRFIRIKFKKYRLLKMNVEEAEGNKEY